MIAMTLELEEIKQNTPEENGGGSKTLRGMVREMKQQGEIASEDRSGRRLQEETLKQMASEPMQLNLAARIQASIALVSPETKTPETSPHAEYKEGSPEAFAQYINADPNNVRDIIIEARRLRVAMGKMSPGQAGISLEHTPVPEDGKGPWTEKPAAAAEEHAVSIAAAETENARATEKPATIVEVSASIPTIARAIDSQAAPESPATIEDEVSQFVSIHSDCSSIDIIDFIRYLKGKGYSIQERIILEKIYVKIEDRKKEARTTVEKAVEKLINSTPDPSESQKKSFMQRLKDTGLICDEDEVKRMIRTAALRRA